MSDCICIALSTDLRGFGPNATLLASVLRRTQARVHVRCWCRGFLPESFEQGPLSVEFIAAEEEVSGKYPGYVGPAVFDRLRVIRDALDWDRCLIMDYDQLALCDLAPLFDFDFGDHLLAARMQGPGVDMAYAMRTWIKRPLPQGWEHVANFPYFSMGPLLNLRAMREAGTWERFLAAHEAFGVDEQLSLTAATEGRSIGFPRKWNLFPKQDLREDEVPDGVVHWLGWPKPWHKDAKAWRPEIWEAERSSWEHLRMGLWQKPVSFELEPEEDRQSLALVKRGWRVRIFTHRTADEIPPQPSFPDLEWVLGGAEAFRSAFATESPDQVRVGAWEDASEWLQGVKQVPAHLVLRGGVDGEDADRIRDLGYRKETRLMSGEWPAGGPLPRALDYRPCARGTGVGPGEDLYLSSPSLREECPVRIGESRSCLLHPEPKHVGLCIIATSNYRMYVRPLLRSIRANFLPGHKVTVFLFTDARQDHGSDVCVIPTKHREWPGMTLGRYDLFLEHAGAFEGLEYLFYLDVDMRVIGKVGDEIFGRTVGVLHPGFHDKPRAKWTYECRPQSAAFVGPDEGSHYFAGGFQGGEKDCYLGAVREMADQISRDSGRGLTAVWHDESHWNRYLIDHPPDLVLSPSYCWYADGRCKEFEGRIAVVPKDAGVMRA